MTYKTAGGVVVNERGELLALARTVTRNGAPMDELRLPKGHIDPGETDAEAAIREVGEESGYWKVEIIANLGQAHSSFEMDGVRYERDEHYFLMRLLNNQRDAPQPVSEEEALFEPRWLPAEDAPALMTYPTEKIMAERARDLVRKRKSCIL
ncbi:MAG TPA: NUDIX domain-containing protein [Candidatus Hydrogenedentes bacterium]|nr:NUDIX domain-containing protein [Candidatus Hydrogenedentota bacterium]